jgi:sugar phosphate isomerase/epimerase
MRNDQIAIQLYTLRRLAALDLPGTLRAVADVGYRSVELAGLPETRPGVLARLLDETGLRVMGSHEGIELLRENPGAVADRLAEVGCPRVIVPWMPEAERRTADDVRRFAAELGELSGTFAARGMRLGYHNHSFEFAPLEDTTVWAVLLAELPPEVELELDVYWVSVGGRDPVAETRAAGERVRMIHAKDRAAGAEPHDVPAGEGILPFGEIVAAADAVGVEWYVAELDEPGDALQDIASAFRYLQTLAH